MGRPCSKARDGGFGLGGRESWAWYCSLRGQAVMHSIVGDKTVPTHFALFGPKTLPSKVLRQGSQLFFYPQVHWNFERRSMNLLVKPIAPESGLVIEMINIAKANTSPE